MSEWASMTVYQTVLNVFSGSHMKYYHKLSDYKRIDRIPHLLAVFS